MPEGWCDATFKAYHNVCNTSLFQSQLRYASSHPSQNSVKQAVLEFSFPFHRLKTSNMLLRTEQSESPGNSVQANDLKSV